MITVGLLMILSLLLGLKSRSIDFSLAYTQATIDTPTYLELPLGFLVCGDSSDHVLDLKKHWMVFDKLAWLG